MSRRVLWLGNTMDVPKDSPIVRFMAAVDVAVSELSRLGTHLGGFARHVANSLTALVTYATTGDASYLDVARREYSLAYNVLIRVDGRPISGWVVCETDTCHAYNVARAYVRFAETMAVELAKHRSELWPVVELLNGISNLLFDAARVSGARELRSISELWSGST